MKKDNKEIANALAMFTQLGVSMFVCILIGVAAGAALDRLFGTSPLLLLVFTVLGVIASFKVMYDLLIKRWKD